MVARLQSNRGRPGTSQLDVMESGSAVVVD